MNKPTEIEQKKVEAPVVNKVDTAPKEVAQTPKAPMAENLVAEQGINLIPTLSKEEVAVVEKKKKLNIGSIVSLLILVVVSILIVGFNIVSKMVLNTEKNKLANYEAQVNKMTQKIISSNEISERTNLYQDILGEAYSPKEVVDYINTLAARSGSATVNKFSITGDLTFSIEGEANDLEDISKFWYILSSDPKVESVTLQSVGNNVNSIRFSFKGKFLIDEFLSSAQ
jgi:hypothetical protein